MIFLAPLLLSIFAVAWAKTVTYDFEVGWVTANPDGQFERQTIGINGHWPIPTIEGDVGDRIIVNVLNSLSDQDTSLHFHGLYMNGSVHMDGPVQVTQCPIPPGSRFTYNFTLDQTGTYWYHSHSKGQYPDGLRGPLIIHDPDDPYRDSYDEEIVLTVSDWYHDQMPGLITTFMGKANPTGAEPVPKSALLNETQGLRLSVQPNTTYLFRMINIGAFAGQYIWFEGHTMRITEVDGIYTDTAEADMIYLSAAQRASFLLTTKNDTTENFAIVVSMDTTLFDQIPTEPTWSANVTGWLTYNDSGDFPEPAVIDEFAPFDDMTLVPYDKQELLPPPDQTFHLNVIMDNLRDGANYAFFNNISYHHPTVPTLYTVMTSGENATDPAIYGTYTHSMVLQKDEVVQIIVDNLDPGRHPFHLHGHAFQAIYRSDEEAGIFADSGITESDYPLIPMRRDTIVIGPSGNLVLRFKADNPGVWLFHCHIEWHVISGLMATFIEAPLELQDIDIPQDHYDTCAASNIPIAGNAAGNTEDLFDLDGEPRPPAPLPAGFTGRGIVALVFSCITGFLGLLVVSWYGLADIPEEAREEAGDRIASTDMEPSAAVKGPVLISTQHTPITQ